MNSIFQYIIAFTKSVDKLYLLVCAIFVGILILANYQFGIETKILYNLPTRLMRFLGFYLLYLTAFLIPYLLLIAFKGFSHSSDYRFWLLLFSAPAIFAFKVTAGGWKNWIEPAVGVVWGRYAATVTDLPIRFILVVLMLYLMKWEMQKEGVLWGVAVQNFNWKPYLIMLAFMVPLIAFASTQNDFLAAYPKLRQISFIYPHTNNKVGVNGLYEAAYGIDFITIELFFRGFLVIAFARYAGVYAIIPMAVFYCSIHFGKPVLECVSSFFGGMLLGIVVYETKSIAGGLLVHLGIAWMMEIGSYIGNTLRHPV